jgi:hypothetical protein
MFCAVHVFSRESVCRQQLGKDVPVATKNCWRRHFKYGPSRMNSSKRLVLPRTSCLNIGLDCFLRHVHCNVVFAVSLQ